AVALVYQWCWVAGLAIGSTALWLGTTLVALAALGAAWRDLGQPALGERDHGDQRWAIVLTGIIVLATLALRLADIESLALPPWVDSLHHTLLVRVAAETGTAPISLAPYLPVSELPYHWGYHVVIATLLRLSGLGLPELMLLSGQMLNALHALTVAGLALALWRRPAAAPVAALVVGLVSLMPAYYLSWGRYTQLTGLLVLPGLAIAWQQGLAGRGRGWWAVAALTLAGLSLIHFRVLLLGAALLAAISLVWAVGQSWAALKGRIGAAVATTVAAAALTVPWLALLASRALLPAVADGGLTGGGSYNALNDGLLWVAPNRLLVALALAGAWAGLRRRATAAASMLLWVALMVIMANPWLLPDVLKVTGVLLLIAALHERRLALGAIGGALLLGATVGPPPYFWLITNDIVVISFFLPLAVLIGGGAALLYARLATLGPVVTRSLAPASVVLLAAVGLWGAQATRDHVLNEATVLAGSADRAAIAWAAANTAPEARFLVNAVPWLPSARRGSDGGWWLLPLAGRYTTMPPVLYVYGSPAYVAHVNAVADTVAAYTPGAEQAIFDLIVSERITHIYLTEGKGPLQPQIFAGRPGFTQVYAQDGVTIFAVDRPSTAAP
ncbi:MAG: hypothetical protein WCG26_05470, partial [Chloroflexales bacterium]